MDLSLWDPPVVQVADDGHLCNRNDWYCDFHFGHGHDVIEEDALNETSCMQVLKLLIAKTDDEIMQLEGDISALETSLASANTELCKLCSVVREKTDCLEKSIQLCKDVQDEHDPGLQLQSHTEPAKGVHEIIKGLPCKDLQQKTDQCGSATVSIPSVLAGVVGKKKVMSKNSEAPEDKTKIIDFNSLDKGEKQNPHDRIQQNMRNFTELTSAPTRSPFLSADDVGSQKVVRRVFDHETEETKKVSDPPHNDEMEDLSVDPQQKMEGISQSNGCNSSRSSIENILEDSSAMVSGEDLENTDGKYNCALDMKGLSSSSSKGGREVNCSKTHEVASSAPRSKTETPVCFAEDPFKRQDHERRLETARQKKESKKKPVLSQQKKLEMDSLLQIKGKCKRLTEFEPITVASLLEQINGKKDANRTQKKVKGKLQGSHVKEPEALIENVSIKKEHTKLKRKHHLKPETVDQSPPEESGFNVAALEMIKRHKSGPAALLELNNTIIEKEEESDLVRTKLADSSLASIITTANHIPNSNNESTFLPLSYEVEDTSNLQIESAKMHAIMMKIKLEESTEITSCSSTSDSRFQIAEGGLSVSVLEKMTLVKLKDIARCNNLKRYNKLPKARLVSFLAKELKLDSSQQ